MRKNLEFGFTAFKLSIGDSPGKLASVISTSSLTVPSS